MALRSLSEPQQSLGTEVLFVPPTQAEGRSACERILGLCAHREPRRQGVAPDHPAARGSQTQGCAYQASAATRAGPSRHAGRRSAAARGSEHHVPLQTRAPVATGPPRGAPGGEDGPAADAAGLPASPLFTRGSPGPAMGRRTSICATGSGSHAAAERTACRDDSDPHPWPDTGVATLARAARWADTRGYAPQGHPSIGRRWAGGRRSTIPDRQRSRPQPGHQAGRRGGAISVTPLHPLAGRRSTSVRASGGS